jgi:hypothetical protein
MSLTMSIDFRAILIMIRNLVSDFMTELRDSSHSHLGAQKRKEQPVSLKVLGKVLEGLSSSLVQVSSDYFPLLICD